MRRLLASSFSLALCAALLSACSDDGGNTRLGTDSGSGDAGRRDGGDGGAGSMDALPGGDSGGGGEDTGTSGGDAAQGGDAQDDVQSVYDTSTGSDACGTTPCTPAPTGCAAMEDCGATGSGNGLDDNCNGVVDEICQCIPGTVEDCFLGPPARRGMGACRAGTQRCQGSGEFGTWGACTGGISPSNERCDNLDNDCNGCSDEGLCCNGMLSCPGPGDPRVPAGVPFQNYELHAGFFFTGPARAWHWAVQGGPCDTMLPSPTFTLTGADSQNAIFHPTLSGDYTVTLTITQLDGTTVTCTFVVFIAGPGLRVEMCWDTNTTVDLDLYLHDPRNMNPWFSSTGPVLNTVTAASCNWANCEGALRSTNGLTRSNWGYSNSPLAVCGSGPSGADWRALGYCANPRLDIDNNLSMGRGLPENINVDNPRDGESFRVMVQNFTGGAAHPIINVYCGGHLRGTLGAAPNQVPSFTGPSGNSNIGAMWRAADVRVHVDATGTTTGCDVSPIHPPGMTAGHYVTTNVASF